MFLRPTVTLIALVAAVSPAAYAQSPAEIPALSQDYAEDLLALFSWGLDIRFTDAEKIRFIKERKMEWESGSSNWQCQFIGDYWTFLILSKERVAGNKEPMKKRLLDFVVANAKAGQPDVIWIQKRLGQDDEVEELPVSKARRAPLEKLPPDAVVDAMMAPTPLGGTYEVRLKASEVSDCLSKVSEMLQTPFTPEQRTEFVERAKKHWRKYREDWGGRVVSSNKNLLSYVNDTSTYMVYKYDVAHNEKEIRSFTERGERDAVWLMKIFDNSWHRAPLVASEPGLSRRAIGDYTALRAQQLNEILGQKAAIADVPAIVKMQKEILAKWPTMPAAKKEAILTATRALSSIYQVYPHFSPMYQEYQKHLWGQEMVASIPQIKPVVEARAAEFGVTLVIWDCDRIRPRSATL